MRGEVGAVDRTADGCDGGREAFSKIASVEHIRAVAGDGPERRREIGLLEHLSCASPAATGTEELRGLVVVCEALPFFADRLGEYVAHRKAVLGVSDRGSESAIEAETAVVGDEIGESRDKSRDGRDRGAGRRESGAEGVGVEPVWCRAGAVVHGHVARSRVVRQREHVAADRRAMRHDDSADRGRGDRRVGRVSALAQSGHARGRCEVMSARDQTVRSSDRSAGRQLPSMVLKGRMGSRHARPERRPRR